MGLDKEAISRFDIHYAVDVIRHGTFDNFARNGAGWSEHHDRWRGQRCDPVDAAAVTPPAATTTAASQVSPPATQNRQPTASTIAAPQNPVTVVTTAISSLLAAVASPSAGNTPAVPADTPLAWMMLAAASREAFVAAPTLNAKATAVAAPTTTANRSRAKVPQRGQRRAVGLPSPDLGFPVNYYLNAAENHAWDAFWSNAEGPNGLGLQDNYAQTWENVASYFNGNPAVIGYAITNEPFPGSSWLATLFGS